MMQTRIQKWGNSLAIRIPKTFATETGLAENSLVELDLSEGQLIIRPSSRKQPTLEELLRDITPENLHGEWETGPAVGGEAW